MINLSLGCCVFVQYIALSEIHVHVVRVLKTVTIVTSEHLNLPVSMISLASQSALRGTLAGG